MCGIVGYIGGRPARDIILNAMKRLEYRGYDSAGISVNGTSITTAKDIVRVDRLAEIVPELPGNAGIGHTRWATHGEPSQRNAHPHTDCSGKIVGVHNGVITNYQVIKDMLIKEGHVFVSETDTEVFLHLIEKYYRDNIEMAVIKAMDTIEGTYAIAVMVEGVDKLIAARKGSPLIIGVGDGENMIASDIPGVLEVTHRVIYLEDGDMSVITPREVRITNGGQVVVRDVRQISWNVEDVGRCGYEHFMLKEIHEEPKVIRDTLWEFRNVGCPLSYPRVGQNRTISDMLILACGTSYHAGLIGKYVFEELTDMPVRVELASEVNHRDRITPVNSAVAITQSGETADVLMAMRKLKENGTFLSVVTNVKESSASRLSDQTVHICAGLEVSVAATKSFVCQLVALYKMALCMPGDNPQLRQQVESGLNLLPGQVEQILADDSEIARLGYFLSQYSSAFFIGRGINYPIALEGALKLKEISYIHAEGFAAGEIKHGPFALLQHNTPVIAVVAQDKTYDSMITNIREITSRKSPVIAVVGEADLNTEKYVDYCIKVPQTISLLSPVLNTIVLQLLAYHAAKHRGCPIDFPRNLAKSVTVE